MRIAHIIGVLKPAALALLAAATLWGQFNRNSYSLRGEISTDSPYPADVTVELLAQTDGLVVDRAVTGIGRGFEFSNLPGGDYMLRLIDRRGNIVREDFVHLTDNTTYVTIRLPQSRVERPVSGQVSVAQLSHKVPNKAQQEFRKAGEANRKGDSQPAIAHLQKAIEIDPAFMEAYNNLGACYMRLKQYDKALEQLQKAYELDRNQPSVLDNVAVANLNLHRYAEAEKAAREALRLDATSNKSRFLLGLALCSLQRKDEALEELGAAAREFPKAHLAAAELLARQGDAPHAAIELKAYLGSGNVERREQLQAWLEQLERANPVASVQAPR